MSDLVNAFSIRRMNRWADMFQLEQETVGMEMAIGRKLQRATVRIHS